MGLKKTAPSPSQLSKASSPPDPTASKRRVLRDRLLSLAEPALEELSRQIHSPHIDPDTKRELALEILKDSGVSLRSNSADPDTSISSLHIPAVSEALKSAFQGLGFAMGLSVLHSTQAPPIPAEGSHSKLPEDSNTPPAEEPIPVEDPDSCVSVPPPGPSSIGFPDPAKPGRAIPGWRRKNAKE